MARTVSSIEPQFVIVRHKLGRQRVLAKVVVARPSNETVIAMPYKDRPVATPSLPLEALELARRAGATAWVVRFDRERRCYRLPLESAVLLAERKDDGELYVELKHFQRCQWLEWDYVERVVEV